MSEVVRLDESLIKKLFPPNHGFEVDREDVFHISARGRRIVSIYSAKKYAEFDEDYRDPLSHGPNLRLLLHHLKREGYETNLK